MEGSFVIKVEICSNEQKYRRNRDCKFIDEYMSEHPASVRLENARIPVK